ncbi:hypothetical protein PoB_006717400 [Plakobranchus ocellatus]|uniref:Uncharacterized protein n=1 Tax=Plakobranchus ocellatus TaxID=259542 RepID=A0AAV4D911_9GAST|nr:hypothetical protein PoB_006717400 [Plakobranchus ocellatus]
MVEKFALQCHRIKKVLVLSVAMDLSAKYSVPTNQAPIDVPWAPEVASSPPETSLYIKPIGRKEETCLLAMRAQSLETIASYTWIKQDPGLITGCLDQTVRGAWIKQLRSVLDELWTPSIDGSVCVCVTVHGFVYMSGLITGCLDQTVRVSAG